MHGIDPWLVRPNTPVWPLTDVLFYPGPAILVVSPLRHLMMPVAAGVFMGVSSALLAWVLTESAIWRLWLLGTPSFVVAAAVGQWSPLLVAATLVPTLGFALACKPTLGLACWIFHPTWRGAIGVAVIGVISMILWPHWLPEWLANLHGIESHPSPIMTPFGWILLLALLRWRQPEARLLLAMACVPQLLFFADQLPLGLVARTRGELVAMAGAGIVAFIVWFTQLRVGDLYVAKAAPFVMVGCYLPSLIIILRRPNCSPSPHTVDSPTAGLMARSCDDRASAADRAWA
jgi:hypothetical protein